jgi:hypothetical protein
METTPWILRPARGLLGVLAALVLALPAAAGQLTWTPGGEIPALVLNLGDGTVKQTVTLPSGATSLDLTLRKFLAEDDRFTLTWKSDGELWMRQTKKIPGDETTDRVALPPGRRITLEVATLGGTPLATITLRRN